jgi:tripeptidyl-peptidase-2
MEILGWNRTGTKTKMIASFQIPDSWENPSGEYRVGIKPLYELYTQKVREKIEGKRKEENWEKAQALASAAALRGSPLNNANNNQMDKLEKEEAEARLEALDLLEKKYKDWGPLLHCVLFRDREEKWRVALSVSPDLTPVTLLREYAQDQSYIYLTQDDKLTVSVNVWEDGNRLEIVGICSGHGTHVASIAAGYFPDNPALNGVAPGAQVISLSIGDGRLGSMETGTAISRAAAFIQRNSHRISVINMSYGEHAHWGSSG